MTRKQTKMGRPEVPFDWEQFEALCRIQCTQEEIASVLKVSVDTVERRCKREYGKTFAELYEEKSAGGKMALRRAQAEMAFGRPAQYDKDNRLIRGELRPDHTMQIWLGKQWLHQKDEIDLTHGGEIAHNHRYSADPWKDLAEVCNRYNIVLSKNGKATRSRRSNGAKSPTLG